MPDNDEDHYLLLLTKLQELFQQLEEGSIKTIRFGWPDKPLDEQKYAWVTHQGTHYEMKRYIRGNEWTATFNLDVQGRDDAFNLMIYLTTNYKQQLRGEGVESAEIYKLTFFPVV